MTEQELAAIRARLEAATPGPWFYDGHCEVGSAMPFVGGRGDVISGDAQGYGVTNDPDGTLIAHAPADVAALLAEVERLRIELARPHVFLFPTCQTCGIGHDPSAHCYKFGDQWIIQLP